MEKTLEQIREAIEKEDDQHMAYLLNEMSSKYPLPSPGRTRPGTAIYANQCRAFIKTKDWPAHSWRRSATKEAGLLVRASAEFVYRLVRMAPVEVFDIPQISTHPVWRHFRSISSEGRNSIMHVITRQTQSAQWVDRVLEEHGSYLFEEMKGNRMSCWRGCIQWSYEVSTAGLEVFIKHGWLDLNNEEDLVEVMTQAAANGRLNIVQWAHDMTGCSRIPHVEPSLMRHRRLNGKTHSVEVGEAWKSMQERWGPAPDEVVREVWRVLMKNHRIAEGKRITNTLSLIESEMDSRKLWDPSDRAFLLNEAFNQLNSEVLAEYLMRGWKFDEEQMAQCVDRANRSSMEFSTKKEKEKLNEMVGLLNRERLLHISGNLEKRTSPGRPSL